MDGWLVVWYCYLKSNLNLIFRSAQSLKVSLDIQVVICDVKFKQNYMPSEIEFMEMCFSLIK